MRDAFRDRLLDRANDQLRAEFLRATIAEFIQLGKMMSGVDVQQRRPKRLFRQSQEADRILAAREKQRRAFELARDFPHDVNGFGLEMLEMVQMVALHGQ